MKRSSATMILVSAAASVAIASLTAFGVADTRSFLPNLYPFSNSSGQLQTLGASGALDLNNPFFQSLGTNGRSCASCHLPDQGWSISASKVQERFDATSGEDPIFRKNDGSNCDFGIDTSTLKGRQDAYSLLTSRGLIRVAIDVPDTAEFEIASVKNPYGCDSSSTLSMYRRPLPSANLRALSTLMWDGRESTLPFTRPITFATNPGDLLLDLQHQAVSATLGHAEAGAAPTSAQQRDIVDFEMALTTAQTSDNEAGDLGTLGATGGPVSLSRQEFYVGINDSLGGNPTGAAFTPVVFSLFGTWVDLSDSAPAAAAKRAVARGEALFNSRIFNITGVGGLNDDLNAASIAGTCGTCHDSPNFGNHSLPVPLNIGVSDVDGPLDTSYLPVFTVRNKTTHRTVKTTDPGRALITGKWKDIGKVKGPILRGLTSRAPFFHNGSATTLADVIEFYNTRFNMRLTAQEKSDFVAFLRSL
jgi:cytochrome c peroxidase